MDGPRRRIRRMVLFSALLTLALGAAGRSDHARPAGDQLSLAPQPNPDYRETLTDLHRELGRSYPCFELKGIDWNAVGEELLPRAASIRTDEEFGRLVLELVARLEDSHAYVRAAGAPLPTIEFPRWDPGFSCLIDDHDRPVVYFVDPGGPADRAGVRAGMTVISINDEPAEQLIADTMDAASRYAGYSSERYLRYQAARWFVRRHMRGEVLTIELRPPDSDLPVGVRAAATMNVRYLPRLPVPIEGTSDSANVSWTRLDDNIGYIYVRRIRDDLIPSLDRAVRELENSTGLIIDVRGNSGGGFDASRSHLNFDAADEREPDRPRYDGPMALLIDSRCISAGEGWASWFIARKRARVFGEATAGASSRKQTYRLINGAYDVISPVKAYRGFLDRPIERRGLEPDVEVRPAAADLAAGVDTVLERARSYLGSER